MDEAPSQLPLISLNNFSAFQERRERSTLGRKLFLRKSMDNYLGRRYGSIAGRPDKANDITTLKEYFMFKSRSAKICCAIVSALALGVAASLSVADSLNANRTVVQPGETLELTFTANQASSQDIYLALMLDNALLFVDANGGITPYTPGTATPARLKSPAAGNHSLLTFTMPDGFFKNVTVYQAAGMPGSDVLLPGNYDPTSLHSVNLSFTQKTVAPTVDGRALYATNCASCHGSSPRNNYSGILRGTSAQATLNAIRSGRGGMDYLSTLSDSEISAIAAWISNPI